MSLLRVLLFSAVLLLALPLCMTASPTAADLEAVHPVASVGVDFNSMISLHDGSPGPGIVGPDESGFGRDGDEDEDGGGRGRHSSVPEPATLLLLGAGLAAVGLIRRR